MKTWGDWSDEDLSSEIMGLLHGEQVKHWCLSDCETFVYDCGPIGEDFFKIPVFKINNPVDMWPIIFDNGISLIWFGGPDDLWKAQSIHVVPQQNSNPLRAAAIVFLMMNGVTPNEN